MQPCSNFFWRSLPLSHRTGSDIFDALFLNASADLGAAFELEQIAVLLESPYPLPADSLPEQATSMARYSICAGRPRMVGDRAQLWTPEIEGILPLLRQMESLKRGEISATTVEGAIVDCELPFFGGWLGWLGYDFAWGIERLPWLRDDKLPFPVALWYEPAEFAVLDHFEQTLWLAAETSSGLDRLTAQADNSFGRHSVQRRSASRRWKTHSLQFETQQADFEQAVRTAKAHIRAGDVFQVNHSLRFSAQTNAPSWEVYRTLQQINPSPFASYWRSPWGDIASCSPERLVQLKSGKVQSRPIAGTRPRGETPAVDTQIASELRGDRKEQAEHIMLVDLERNDLGRVCEWGSVAVEELMAIERYSHVMHLVSNVTGKLQDSTAALVASMFPGGTITGCPKVRCMEIIEAIEPVRRSLFYGSCGYFDRRGRLDLNILIRTLLLAVDSEQPALRKGQQGNAQKESSRMVWGQVGAGIVADSQPEREWVESLQKAKAQLLALGL